MLLPQASQTPTDPTDPTRQRVCPRHRRSLVIRGRASTLHRWEPTGEHRSEQGHTWVWVTGDKAGDKYVHVCVNTHGNAHTGHE